MLLIIFYDMMIDAAGTFNIPKFFEFEIQMNSEGEYDYETTALNEDKAYIVFCSWWVDLIVFGIVPLVSLVVFNMKIYLKVRSSDRLEYRFVGRKTQLSKQESATVHFRYVNTEKVHIAIQNLFEQSWKEVRICTDTLVSVSS